jgi:hypothetical protein
MNDAMIVELLNPIQPKKLPAANTKQKPPPSYAGFSQDNSYDIDKMNILIAEEIGRIPLKSRWRSLGKSYQWELICKYLEDQDQYEIVLVPEVKERLKRTLQANHEVKVLFDHVNSRIQKICDH